MRKFLKWSAIGCGGLMALLVVGFVGLVIAAMRDPSILPATSTPTVIVAAKPAATAVPPAAPPATAIPTATVQPATAITVPPTPVPATATALPAPTVAPTAVPKAAPPTDAPTPSAPVVDFSGAFKPRLLKVGEKLVVELSIENKSDRPIEGLRIFSSGPWGKFTVVNVMPAGNFESGLLGYNIYSRMTVPPGQKRVVSIIAYPNEPGTHDFTFIPNYETTALVGADGKGIVIGGQVAVTR